MAVIDLEKRSCKRSVSNLRIVRKENSIKHWFCQVVYVRSIEAQRREIENEFHSEATTCYGPVVNYRGNLPRPRSNCRTPCPLVIAPGRGGAPTDLERDPPARCAIFSCCQRSRLICSHQHHSVSLPRLASQGRPSAAPATWRLPRMMVAGKKRSGSRLSGDIRHGAILAALSVPGRNNDVHQRRTAPRTRYSKMCRKIG